MPSFDIHLAIAKKYVEKNIINDENVFFEGNVAPDLAINTKISHYTKKQDKNNLVQYLENKVSLKSFLENEQIYDDYQKGIFLHLITDYLFFTTFLDKNYLQNISYEEFRKDLYYSYNMVNQLMISKYQINYDKMLSKKLSQKIKNRIIYSRKDAKFKNEVRCNLINNDKLDLFINEVSSINLADYQKKILSEKNK